jgi:hypothetical protein
MGVEFTTSTDGRRLTGTDGPVSVSLAWSTRELAEANREAGEQAIRKAIEKGRGTLSPGQHKALRRIGSWSVAVQTGPPTWWRPRVQIDRRHVRIGWLRLAVGIWWTKPAGAVA